MSYQRDAVLAAIIAVLGGAALIFYPAGDAGDPPGPPMEQPGDTPEEGPEEPGGLPEETPEDPPEEEPADPPVEDPPTEDPPVEDPEPPAAVDETGSPFSYDPPGELTEYDFRDGAEEEGFSGTGFQGTANFDRNYVFAPDMDWPLDERGFPNSQVYRPGGYQSAGGQCDASNYDYPWQDNFCETRGHGNAFCQGGQGHQGQDIRPASCPPVTGGAHMAVAAADGYISNIGSISVWLRDEESGRTYWYMHLNHWDSCGDPATLSQAQCNSSGIASICSGNALEVEVGDAVSAGDPIGEVSNWFGIGWDADRNRCVWRATTEHLHFEIHDTVSPDGDTAASMRVPPYSSLVTAYLDRLSADPALYPEWEEAEY
ncbi:M23 family metallopeptidase [Maricaulaceae bacterium MS644]